MKTQVEGKLLRIICSCLLILASGTTVSSQTHCHFNYLFHFGDGFTDIGNSIHVLPNVTIPPGLPPYGMSLPHNVTIPLGMPPYGMSQHTPCQPTGRWSDGLVDFDFSAVSFGLPNITPYLTMNQSNARSYDGVIFSVGRSPVLARNKLKAMNITIPDYVVPLREQFQWFTSLLTVVCSNDLDCKRGWLNSSLVLMGDIEGNDIGYGLTQGKSIEDVKLYVESIIEDMMDYTEKIIELGATRVIIPGNVPLGCYPYILTALQTNDTEAYDELGCLKSVNNLTIWKNHYLEQAIKKLKFRHSRSDVQIFYGPMYDGIRKIIANASNITAEGNTALKSCCGIGGKYNFDPDRFCSDAGVPVCDNPNDYIFWDGEHFTQQTQFVAEQMLVQPALKNLNCTTSTNAFLRPMRDKIISSVINTYVSSY